MSVPPFKEFLTPVLAALGDGEVHSFKDVKSEVAESMHLTEEDLAERVPSGNLTRFNNMINWARTYLKKAGLVIVPKRSYIQITEEGKKLLASGETITDELLISRYPEYAKFRGAAGKGSSKPDGEAPAQPAGPAVPDSPVVEDVGETPQETMDRVYATINDQLAEDLLEEVMSQSPAFFENLVIDLLKSMGYGEGSTTREKISSDGGIDGIMHEDRLGFNLIYIQAKRWDPEKTVGRPVLQAFAGAMMGPPRVDKGLFITTAHFSKEAKQYADDQHIILIDGKRLSELMVEYDVGVTTQKTYRIKRIDSDYFSES